MSFKITFIDAGSISFTRVAQGSISVEEFKHIRVAFTDINEANLAMVIQLCQKDIHENGLDIQIEATTNRREALVDAKYTRQLRSAPMKVAKSIIE